MHSECVFMKTYMDNCQCKKNETCKIYFFSHQKDITNAVYNVNHRGLAKGKCNDSILFMSCLTPIDCLFVIRKLRN